MLAVAKDMYPCPISERGHFGSHVVVQKQGPLASTARHWRGNTPRNREPLPSVAPAILTKRKKKKAWSCGSCPLSRILVPLAFQSTS